VTGQVVQAASRRIAAAPSGAKWAMLGVGMIAASAAVWLVRSGKAGKLVKRVRPVVREMGEIYGPPLAETFARYDHGRVVFARAAVRPAAAATLAERIARVLAFRGTPVLAEDIARELGAPGNLRDRTRLVRAELRRCIAFVEVSRGRWVLGEPGGGPTAPLPFTEVVNYLDRVHKDTRRTAARVEEPAVNVPVKWTGSSGHLLHDRQIPSWFRDGLAALIAELEAAAPPGLADRRTAFRQQGQTAKIKVLSPELRAETAMNQLLDLRLELLVAVKLIRAGALTKISKETPDFECSWQGKEFGIEVTTRARLEVGSAMHKLLERGLSSGPDIGVTLIRSGKLLFSEDPGRTAVIADRVVTAIKERAAAAAGRPVTGSIPIPELGLTAMQIKDPIENKGRKTYGLPSIVVLDVSRLGSARWEPAEASWTGKFQDVLDDCQLGNLGGALVVRSELGSEILEALCWRGEQSLAQAAAAVLLGGQMPKTA
jgi:hypothetical protein